jgi:hypothetical protein
MAKKNDISDICGIVYFHCNSKIFLDDTESISEKYKEIEMHHVDIDPFSLNASLENYTLFPSMNQKNRPLYLQRCRRSVR